MAVGYLDQRALPRDIVRAQARTVDDSRRRDRDVGGARRAGTRRVRRIRDRARTACAADDDAAVRRRRSQRFRAARPTAVNLAWAVDRVRAAGATLAAARDVHEEQRAVDRAIARYGAELLPASGAVLTHCNTGPLATAGSERRSVRSSPRMQAANGCTFSSMKRVRCCKAPPDDARVGRDAGVPATLIVDAAAATTMVRKEVRAVIVGADRIACNGDTANKIGTLRPRSGGRATRHSFLRGGAALDDRLRLTRRQRHHGRRARRR